VDGIQNVKVAILLATYNGARFVEQQIDSYRGNDAPFSLHWLDDHSSDNTRDLVRSVTRNAGIELKEWHQTEHLGIPAAFFRLLECVESDIYLFSDQDDIWERGKIDAVVTHLAQKIASHQLCFTDPLMFRASEPTKLYSLFDVLKVRPEIATQESRLFMGLAQGNTQAFTRALRELFLTHKDTARSHALMHDLWMYSIAVASGNVALLSNRPTTLYRCHDSNASASFSEWTGSGSGRLAVTWAQHQMYRRRLANHAQGFIQASVTLPKGAKLDRALEIARLIAGLDHRQSLVEMARLVLNRAMWPSRSLAAGLATACLCSDARA
jgi:glycosyltransferase involved in cell wall biosynthesis